MASADEPQIGPGGLVTVAYLKARLDAGEDQLGMFMPLVLDVVPTLSNANFTAIEVQQALTAVHKVTMPQATIGTLLRRCTRRSYLLREAGRFTVNPDKTWPPSVAGELVQVQTGQVRLAHSLQQHANMRGLTLKTNEEALDLLLRFLSDQQVDLLLGAAPRLQNEIHVSRTESIVVAEFLHEIVRRDLALTSILKGILEGLVIYHAAFLPELETAQRHFRDLTVVFDSGLVRQALGYEGPSGKDLIAETIDLLRSSGIKCVVFDKTVQEIHRILAMYEQKLGTATGRSSIRPGPMARYFLTERFSPSDIREMSVLLERDIATIGLRIVQAPERSADFTLGESRLAERLADPRTHDIDQPRVLHDVDCAAGILTMRRSHRSRRIEDVRAVFVTTSVLVIQNTKLWWEEDERESGISPIIHIRSLANLAWLKKPTASPDLQLKELVVLCAAAMRPSQRVWQRFLSHLDSLQASQRLTPDLATAIIASSLSDDLLRDAELSEDDPDDIDANTLDEVVARVVSTYEEKATRKIETFQVEADKSLLVSSERANSLAAKIRRDEMLAWERAGQWASNIGAAIYWPAIGVVILASILVFTSNKVTPSWIGIALAIAIMLFTVLELIGILDHARSTRLKLEIKLRKRLYRWLRNDDQAESPE